MAIYVASQAGDISMATISRVAVEDDERRRYVCIVSLLFIMRVKLSSLMVEIIISEDFPYEVLICLWYN